MQRNMELVRQLLFEVEKNDDPYALIDPKIEGHNEVEISYHIMLLDQAGLLNAQDRSAIGVFRWSAARLTWDGHEFLDAARDDATWKEATERLSEANPGPVFDVLKALLVDIITKRAKG